MMQSEAGRAIISEFNDKQLERAAKMHERAQIASSAQVAKKGEAVCANAECREQLVHPLLHCARCKAVAYCSKGVGRRAQGG